MVGGATIQQLAPHVWLHESTPTEALISSLETAGWAIVSAAKDYYIKIKGTPRKNDPEYLVAKRNNRLYLNLIDADDPNYISAICINAALLFITEYIKKGFNVFVHCDHDRSRSPSIVLLWMAIHGYLPEAITKNPELAIKTFKHLYPPYIPNTGIRQWLIKNWFIYKN